MCCTVSSGFKNSCNQFTDICRADNWLHRTTYTAAASLSPACGFLLLPCHFPAAFLLFSCRHPVAFLSLPAAFCRRLPRVAGIYCDAFWSKIAEIMAWFLIVTHNRVTEDPDPNPNPNPNSSPTVYSGIYTKLQDGRIADESTLQQSFTWQKRVYKALSRHPAGYAYATPEEQCMVENHEDYYQGCVRQMIQRWRKRLGEGLSAEESANPKGSAMDITLSVGASYEAWFELYREHVDAIDYIGRYIAEKLGRMYGLQIFYYRDTYNVGMSIAGRVPNAPTE